MKKNFLSLILLFCILCTGNSFAQDKPKVYLVADAHLDTQWNWDIQTTINEYVRHTLSQNLYLLKHYPDYVFNFEGAVKYAWMKEYYPAQYEEMKKYIAADRWHLAGSSWDATDAIVPSVESAIRNILLGQSFYRNEFNREGTDIFLPDCFGFGWTLPTVATHCGLIGFSTQKLQWRVNPFYGDKKYPFTIGLWKGIDGSQIMEVHGFDYSKGFPEMDLSENSDLLKIAEMSPLHKVYRYYGTGDRGGSPSLSSVIALEKGLKGNGSVQIISATSDRLYKEYLPYSQHPELPVFDGELTMDVHGTGCYTSKAIMKLYNRQNEQMGDAAERAAVTAECLGMNSYPKEELTKCWQRFIFHQFHDDLTGTSIPRAYEFSWNDELISLKQFSDVLTSSVNAVTQKMDTKVKGTPIILYNAHAYPVSASTEITLNVPSGTQTGNIYDEKGNKVQSQFLGSDKGKAKWLVSANVPATGYAVYDFRAGKSEKAIVPTSVNSIENSVYKVTLDKNGDISSLLDKKNNKELVESGKVIRLAVFTEDPSYEWPSWEIIKTTTDRSPISITDHVRITSVENGPIRKSLCIEKQYGDSKFKQYIRLYEGNLADRIDFCNEVDWRSANTLLKAEFPLNVSNPKATYDLGLGTIQRENNTLTAYEVFAQQWADLTDTSNLYGVSILNDCKYGWDKPDDHTLRLTLIHTPGTNKRYIYQGKQDMGFHTFTYSLIGHVGALDVSSTAMAAEVLNQPLKAFVSTKHGGSLGKSYSFVSSNNSHVAIKALKKAEASDDYIIRVYETGGKEQQKAEISFATSIESARVADGTEKEIGQAVFSGNKLLVTIEPSHIQTFKIKLKRQEETPANSFCLSIPYDKRCFSWNEFRHEGNFESGYSYAAELLPDSILNVDNIPFKLGDKNANDGLVCKGNILKIPAGHSYNRLYFLAASTDKDTDGTFTIGNLKKEIAVPYYSGFIGQWGHEGQTKGYLKEGEIAYVGTHRHEKDSDCAYEFTYMFKFGMDIPKGAATITLPQNDHIVIFAVTLANEVSPSVVPACEMFRTSIK